MGSAPGGRGEGGLAPEVPALSSGARRGWGGGVGWRRGRVSGVGLRVWAGLVLAAIYLPVLVLMVFSFNRSKLGGIWRGFTFEWYERLLHNRAILSALERSLAVAAAATAISVVLGSLAAMGLWALREQSRRAGGGGRARARAAGAGTAGAVGLFHLPIVTPDIIQAIALLAFFAAIGFARGLATIVIAHATFGTAYVFVIVRSALAHYRSSYDEAAMDLGARPLQVLLRVRIPILIPSILAGALLVFTLSFDDFLIAFFNAGRRSTTLPIQVYSMIKFGVTPEVNALFTIIFVVTSALIGLFFLLERREVS